MITDLQMPRVDGGALITTLRERRRTLKVLCISGSKQPPPPGADAFIARPFLRDTLLTQVRALLDGR